MNKLLVWGRLYNVNPAVANTIFSKSEGIFGSVCWTNPARYENPANRRAAWPRTASLLLPFSGLLSTLCLSAGCMAELQMPVLMPWVFSFVCNLLVHTALFLVICLHFFCLFLCLKPWSNLRVCTGSLNTLHHFWQRSKKEIYTWTRFGWAQKIPEDGN